jgi:glutamine amidotransferase PdxT
MKSVLSATSYNTEHVVLSFCAGFILLSSSIHVATDGSFIATIDFNFQGACGLTTESLGESA